MSRVESRRVGGRYHLVEPIGRGGMGIVWRAHDELLDREVAVKEIRYDTAMDDELSDLNRRTLREARAAGRLTHPNVVVIHDVIEEDGRPWIIMQLVPSKSLGQVLRESGPLPPERVSEIGLQILEALRAAHREGVLHRDVKPENVLLTEDGRVVLTDFGIARLEADSTMTRTGLVGTPAFIAPERLRGTPALRESDLWSLGATLYAAVEGRPPHDRGMPMATMHAVLNEDPAPPKRAGRLAPLLMRLLAKEPADRPGYDEIARMLRQVSPSPASRSGTAADGAARSAASTGAPGAGPAPTPVPAPGPTAEPAAADGSAAAGDRSEPPAPETVKAARTEPAGGSSAARPGGKSAGPEEDTQDLPAPPAEADAAPSTRLVRPRRTADAEAGTAGAESGAAAAKAGTAGEPGGAPDRGGAGEERPAAAKADRPDRSEPAGPAPDGSADRAGEDPDGGRERPEPGASPGRATGGGDGGAAARPAPGEPADRGDAEAAAARKPAVAATATKPRPGSSGTGVRPAQRPIARLAAPVDRGVGSMETIRVAAPPRPRPGLRRTLLKPVVLLILGMLGVAGIAGYLGMRAGGQDPGRPTDTTVTVTPSASASGQTPSSPSASGTPEGSPTPSGTGGEPAAVPEGWYRYMDRTGFSLALPAGWRVIRRSGTQVWFGGPGTPGTLLIDQTSSPKADAEKDWKNQERYVRYRFPGYKRIKIKKVDYWKTAADWEFTYSARGGRMHVVNRGFVTDKRHGYAIYWSTPDRRWKKDYHYFKTFTATFRPAK